MEGADGGNSKGILEGVEVEMLEGGWVGREGLVSIVNKNLHESKGEYSFECIPHALGIGAVNTYCKHLWFLFPRYLFRYSWQSLCFI